MGEMLIIVKCSVIGIARLIGAFEKPIKLMLFLVLKGFLCQMHHP